MLDGKKIFVVMPAYNAEKTIAKTYIDIPKAIVDKILVIDDEGDLLKLAKTRHARRANLKICLKRSPREN